MSPNIMKNIHKVGGKKNTVITTFNISMIERLKIGPTSYRVKKFLQRPRQCQNISLTSTPKFNKISLMFTKTHSNHQIDPRNHRAIYIWSGPSYV